MSPSRTGGSQSTTCTGPEEGKEIESLHIWTIPQIYIVCKFMLMASSPFSVGYM